MNYVRSWYHSVSGVWDSSYEERLDAVSKVREFTGPKKATGRDVNPMLEKPVEVVDTTILSGSPTGQPGKETAEVHSLDELDTGVFDIQGEASTPYPHSRRRESGMLGEGGAIDLTVDEFQILPLSTAAVDRILSNVPTTKGKGLLDGDVQEEPSGLPLDTSIMSAPVDARVALARKELEAIRKQVETLNSQRSQLESMCAGTTTELNKLTEGVGKEKGQLKQLVDRRLTSEGILRTLLQDNDNVQAKISVAQGELDHLKSDTCSLSFQHQQLVESLRKSKAAPVDTSHRSVHGSQSQLNGTTRVSTNTTLAGGPVGSNEPLLKVRSNMTPSEKERYMRNPAIAAMGIDTIPRLTEDLAAKCKHVDFGDVRAPDAVKMKAVEIKPFTGKVPWRKWLARFQANVISNGWTNRQALIALKAALEDGPGEMALRRFELVGDGTLLSLVECGTWCLLRVGEADPKVLLAKRIQKSGEEVRVYGLSIQELVSELYEGCRPDTPMVIQEATTRFVNGIRDPDCQAFLREKWEPEMSMSELFTLADVFETKKAVFPTLGVSSVKVPTAVLDDDTVECAGATQKISKKGKRDTSEQVNPLTSAAELEKFVKNVFQKASAKSGKGKGYKKKQSCRRCQKLGHYAYECRAATPVAETKTEKQSENSGN